MRIKLIRTLLFLLLMFIYGIANARLLTTDSTGNFKSIASDSVGKIRINENKIATAAAVSSLATIIMVVAGYSRGETSFDPLPFVAIFGTFASVAGIFGFRRRKKLTTGKYEQHAKPQKLPLGQTRSLIGILAIPASVILLGLVYSCG